MAGTDSGGNDLLLVTGASGFVGSAIAIAARAAGYRVRVLVRRSSPRINIQPDDEVVIGDIRDRASLVPALRGVRNSGARGRPLRRAAHAGTARAAPSS